MRAINPEVTVTPLARRLGPEELAQLAADHELVLDCSDNFATRHAVNHACVAAGTPLVSGAAVRFSGQLAVFDPRDAASPCYHCLFLTRARPAMGRARLSACCRRWSG